MAMLVRPQTRVGLGSICFGIFTPLTRNVLHFLAHLDFRCQRIEQILRTLTRLGDCDTVKPSPGAASGGAV